MMMKFDNQTNELKFDFEGKDLIRGETDGSSYANGGLRATHCAGGYLTIDTTSPIFLRGDVIYIPSIFVSYHGMALDEKTPLLRANDALSKHGSRLLKHLGYDCPGLKANIGLEQELFLIPREQFYRRPDLQFTGRTIIGSVPPRDQEMNDHYMAPLSQSTPALECMREIQDQCWKMGIPLKTRHREVAPNQFEFAPRKYDFDHQYFFPKGRNDTHLLPGFLKQFTELTPCRLIRIWSLCKSLKKLPPNTVLRHSYRKNLSMESMVQESTTTGVFRH